MSRPWKYEQLDSGWDSVYNMNGIWLLQQAIGIVFIKKTKDPLEAVSKLGYLQLVSSNQKINYSIIENTMHDVQWSDLTDKEKKSLELIFHNRITDNSSKITSKN